MDTIKDDERKIVDEGSNTDQHTEPKTGFNQVGTELPDGSELAHASPAEVGSD